MRCEVCSGEAKENSVICSERCERIRFYLITLITDLAPTDGCSNCWGDNYAGCTDECQGQFKRLGQISRELWNVVHSVMR